MTRPLLIDAHSHINFSAYRDDAPEVIRRATDDGIWMLAVGSQLATSRRAVDYAEQYEHIWAVVGLHPTHLVRDDIDWQEVGEDAKHGVAYRTSAEVFDPGEYRALAVHPRTVGIGECGMDFYHMPTGRDPVDVRRMQEDTFRAQIALAQSCVLPLMVHVRDGRTEIQSTREAETAHEATLRILADSVGTWDGREPRGMIHCYSGTWDQAQRYLGLGFNISFTGVITFTPTRKQLPIAEELWRVVRGVPLDRFHVETDCPYLTPEPHRGKKNEPQFVRHVAERIALLRGMPFEAVASSSVSNTLRLFQKIVR